MFIDGEYKSYTSVDAAMPLGHGQTIPQPTLVYKDDRGKVHTEYLEKVLFLELKGKYGWR